MSVLTSTAEDEEIDLETMQDPSVYERWQEHGIPTNSHQKRPQSRCASFGGATWYQKDSSGNYVVRADLSCIFGYMVTYAAAWLHFQPHV